MNLLLDSILKTSIILAAALVALALMRGRSASLRHWVLSVAIACRVGGAGCSRLVLPSWGIDAAVLRPPSAQGASGQPGTSAEPGAGASVTVETELVPPLAMPASRLLDLVVWAGSVWLAGVVVSLLLLGVGIARLVRVARAARPIDEGAAPSMASAISATWGLERPVTLLLTEDTGLLVTWGILRPKVLLPAASADWSDERLRVVISHELAHVQRGDWVVQLVAEVLRARLLVQPARVDCVPPAAPRERARLRRRRAQRRCRRRRTTPGTSSSSLVFLNARRRALVPDLSGAGNGPSIKP